MKEAKIIPLFSIPLYKGKVEIEESVKNILLNEKYTRMPSGNGHFSENKFILDLPKIKSLKDEVEIHIKNYVYKFLMVSETMNFYIQNSWVVKHFPKDWAQSHSHSNALISGVLYLKTKENSGKITFEKPDGYTNLFHQCMRVPFSGIDNNNCDFWHEVPKDNDILLFPSHLRHYVEKNESNEDRYSLAFNLNVEGIFSSTLSDIDYLRIDKHKPNEDKK